MASPLTAQAAPLWALFVALALAVVALEAALARVAEDHPRRSAWQVLVAGAAAAGLFALALARARGRPAAGSFIAAWILELALSVDNLFVFLLIFRRLGLPPLAQARALRWGLASAVVLRGLFIAAGIALLARVGWAFALFGLILLGSAAKVLVEAWRGPKSEPTPEAFRPWRWLPVGGPADAAGLVTRDGGRLVLSRLGMGILSCELADLVFALDSVPAVLSITQVPIEVFASNVFAIIGLRAMYRLVADGAARLRYLEPALALVLALIGAKMLAKPWLEVGPLPAVAAVLAIFAVAVAASLVWPRRARAAASFPSAAGHDQP